jgi:hypothetical protein
MNATFKSLKIEDFGLSKDELETVVTGSQQFLPPVDEDDRIDTGPEPATS